MQDELQPHNDYCDIINSIFFETKRYVKIFCNVQFDP